MHIRKKILSYQADTLALHSKGLLAEPNLLMDRLLLIEALDQAL